MELVNLLSFRTASCATRLLRAPAKAGERTHLSRSMMANKPLTIKPITTSSVRSAGTPNFVHSRRGSSALVVLRRCFGDSSKLSTTASICSIVEDATSLASRSSTSADGVSASVRIGPALYSGAMAPLGAFAMGRPERALALAAQRDSTARTLPSPLRCVSLCDSSVTKGCDGLCNLRGRAAAAARIWS